jgi:hypothetical protein
VAKSRIELLGSLNQDPGLEAGGLTVKKVMEVRIHVYAILWVISFTLSLSPSHLQLNIGVLS